MKRTQGTGIRSWELSNELWEVVKEFVPEHQWDENRTYSRKPGGRQKPIDPHRALEGIFYVLRIGIPWQAIGRLADYDIFWQNLFGD